jgi:hypothetical protein
MDYLEKVGIRKLLALEAKYYDITLGRYAPEAVPSV